jgi:hypothetical protein
MVPVNLNGFARESGRPFLDHLSPVDVEQIRHVFLSTGMVYSPFGGFVPAIPKFDAFRVLLVIRDPRDVLTSSYYSLAHSHGIPADPMRASAFRQQRRDAQQSGVDEYVRVHAPALANVYRDYMAQLVGRSNVLLTFYEDLVGNFEEWLEEVLGFTGLEVPLRQRDSLREETKQRSEDVGRHMRQVQPGDHLRKLTARTIAELDESLGDVLAAFGYRVQ